MVAATYWNKERLTFAGSILGMLAVGIGGWFHFNDKIDDLTDRVDRIDQGVVEGRCTQILSRQIAAIEKGNTDVQEKIALLARDQGCVRRYDYVLATGSIAGELTEQEKEALRRREEAERKAFEQSMADIDNRLGLHEGVGL